MHTDGIQIHANSMQMPANVCKNADACMLQMKTGKCCVDVYIEFEIATHPLKKFALFIQFLCENY